MFQIGMEDPVKAMLAYAAAVAEPLKFEVRSPDGERREVVINSSHAIIGRGPGSDIRLPEQTVSFRHAYLQAIGPRMACIDLMSVGGIQVSGPPYRGWLTPDHVLRIGSSEIQLLGDHWAEDDETLKPPLEFRPRQEFRPEYGQLPVVNLELMNTQHQGMKWPINRVVTLIGRDERCRITVADDRLSRVQCALLLLPSGLWCVDLLGKGGILFNGEPASCGMLSTGTVLTIGPYQLMAHYPEVAHQQASMFPAGGSNGNSEFLTRTNRIFQTESYHDTLIVNVLPEIQTFYYQDVHIEANRVNDLIAQRGYNHVVIDFSRVDEVGHVVLEGVMGICRSVPGNSVLCNATPNVYHGVQAHPVGRLFHHYACRSDALQAVYLQV